ncbi:MAG: hypothetical protein PHY16_16510 [Methylobacter sp.]|nr:hypothetical protein [Methylobacter sp.]
MITITTLARVNIGQQSVDINRLVEIHEGLALKLEGLGLVSRSPYLIEAGITARKAYTTGLWLTGKPIEADREARLVINLDSQKSDFADANGNVWGRNSGSSGPVQSI